MRRVGAAIQVTTNQGIPIGGGQITGLGGSATPATTGDTTAVAIGDNATASAVNSLALGTGAMASVGNSVALGTGSTASRGP